MNRVTAILVLLLAAVLEASGDAIVRSALHTSSAWLRVLLFLAGAGVLLAYGCVVNAPPWEFGRLIGLYVVFFFVTAQIISWLFFHQPPSRPVWLGGALIIAGGVVILWMR